MADFEELKLTVTLVDDASTGLTNIRAQLTQLTQTAGQVQTALTGVAASAQQVGQAHQQATPHISTQEKALKELSRSAEETTRGLLQMALASRRGAEAFPELALATREAWTGLKGVNAGMVELGAASRLMVVGLGAVTIGIGAVGAAVAAYGISVFKFSREMYTLSQTAKSLGMTFGTLKAVTEQNERFGISVDNTISGLTRMQSTMADLSVSGSQLRQQMISMGIPPSRIDQLLRETDVIKRRNMVIQDQIKIEADLTKRMGPEAAAEWANRYGAPWGVDPGARHRPLQQPQTQEEKDRAAEIERLSQAISIQWEKISKTVHDIKEEFLAWGLPAVLGTVKLINTGFEIIEGTIGRINEGLGHLGTSLVGIARHLPIIGSAIQLAEALRNLGGATAEGTKPEGATPAPATAAPATTPETEGGISGWYHRRYREMEHRQGGGPVRSGEPYVIGEHGAEIMVPDASGVVVPFGRVGGRDRRLASLGGDGDGGGGGGMTTQELIDETEKNTAETTKLTDQLQRLNDYFDRIEGGTAGGGRGGARGGGGNAAGTTGLPRGGYRGKTGDTTSSETPAAAADTTAGNGLGVPAQPGTSAPVLPPELGGPARVPAAATDAGRPASGKRAERIGAAKAAMEDQLRKEGVPEGNIKEAANLLAGQALAESGLDPSLSHDQGTGHGIYGARLGRRSDMHNWLAEHGYDKNSLEGQSRYMAHEAMTGKHFGATRSALMGATPENRAASTDAITRNFEAPARINNRTGQVAEAAGVNAAAPGAASAPVVLPPELGGPAPGAATGDRRLGGRDIRGTDPRIAEIVTAAAEGLPPGYKIRSTSGVRTAGQGQHTLGKAVDFEIVKPDGTVVRNRGDDESGLYTTLARNAYGYQEKNRPELTGKFQWGGQFGTSSQNPNEPDLMHFDIGGRRGRIDRYSRERIGAVLPPDRSALDRQALSKPTEISSKGNLSVDVKAPAGSKVDYSGDNLLKPTSMQRQTQMMPTDTGPNVADTARSYMRGGS